jgi:hypothetical protein
VKRTRKSSFFSRFFIFEWRSPTAAAAEKSLIAAPSSLLLYVLHLQNQMYDSWRRLIEIRFIRPNRSKIQEKMSTASAVVCSLKSR